MISDKEIENVNILSPEDRYKYFIKKVCSFGELWTVVDEEGDIIFSFDRNNNNRLFLFPLEIYVENYLECKENKGNKYGLEPSDGLKARSIELDKFLDDLFFLLKKNEIEKAIVFPAPNNFAEIKSLNKVYQDLSSELEENY